MRSGLKLDLFHLLIHTGKLLEDRVREGLRASGVYHGQARVLEALARNGELSQIQIAEGLRIERPTVTNMIQRMEKSGLIVRTKDRKDPRANKVRLTAAGKRAEAHVRKVWDLIEVEIRSALPPDKVELTGEMLTRIRNRLGGADPDV